MLLYSSRGCCGDAFSRCHCINATARYPRIQGRGVQCCFVGYIITGPPKARSIPATMSKQRASKLPVASTVLLCFDIVADVAGLNGPILFCSLASVVVVVCKPAGGQAGCRARGWYGGRHCTAGQYGYVPIGRHVVLLVVDSRLNHSRKLFSLSD